MPIAYRIYSGPTFCKLEVGHVDTEHAAQAALTEMQTRPDYYTHAVITVDRVPVGEIDKDGKYHEAD